MLFKKSVDNAYERALMDERRKFAAHPVIKEMLAGSVDCQLTELFLIYWSTLSAGLTEPIPEYLKQAGEKCREKGLVEMGRFFYEHAKEEDGHDGWAEKDVHKLVSRWNQRHPERKLDPVELLSRKKSPAVKRYHQLHEEVIQGDTPYGELAIDVEIELITVKFGPRMIWQCIRKAGPRILWDMSFLREHVRFDFGHTDHNFKTVDSLLKEQPGFLGPLADAGKRALKAYGDFLQDVMDYAKEEYRKKAPVIR